MSSLERNIQNWIVNETDGLIEGRLKNLPDISSICRLTEGRNREIWKFVIKRVGSKQSIAFIRKLLRLRRAVKESEKYPDDNKENIVRLLQNKLDNTEDKVRFLEHTTKNVSKHVFLLNTSIKNKKEENAILSQKSTILELATLNLEEKNKSLIVVSGKLFIFLSKLFANENTKCFKYAIDRKSFKNAINENLNFNDAFLNGILDEIMLTVKKKLLREDVNSSVANLIFPVTEIMSETIITDIVNHLKCISQQESNSLQSNIEKARQAEVGRLSETYLQSMKQDLVNSCFQKIKIGSYKCSLEIDDVYFNKDNSKLKKDYLTLHIQNECLSDSIKYLEEKLASELDITQNMKENNANSKVMCQDTEIIMGDFYKKLSVLHGLLNTMPQAFINIRLSLESCRKFIDTQMLSTIKCNKDDCFIDVINDIDCDSKLSFELLENKEYLQDIFKDYTFTKWNFPAKIWEFLSLEPFRNRHLVIEKIASIKTKLYVVPKQLCYTPDEISTLTVRKKLSLVKDNADDLEVVQKNLFELRKSCKRLEIVLKDWWYQNAQYIPAFEHNGKTLKMWLAILNAIDS